MHCAAAARRRALVRERRALRVPRQLCRPVSAADAPSGRRDGARTRCRCCTLGHTAARTAERGNLEKLCNQLLKRNASVLARAVQGNLRWRVRRFKVNNPRL